MLNGKKTYISAGLIAAIQLARALGWITEEMAQTLTNLLLGGGLAFLRMGAAAEEGKAKRRGDDAEVARLSLSQRPRY